jgi:hypothetical protein
MAVIYITEIVSADLRVNTLPILPVAGLIPRRGHFFAFTRPARWGEMLDGARLRPNPQFEAWSDAVRSALVWLGWPDCDQSIKTARAADRTTASSSQ